MSDRFSRFISIFFIMADVVVLRVPKENKLSTFTFFKSLESSRPDRGQTCVCKREIVFIKYL